MKRLLHSLILALIPILFASNCIAQKRCEILSTKAYLGNHSVAPSTKQIVRTNDGGFIIGIDYNSTKLNFTVDCTEDPISSVIVFQKFNATGTVVQWDRCYNYSGDIRVKSIFPLANGEFMATGYGYDSTRNAHGPCLRKEMADGTVLFRKVYGSSGYANVQTIMQMADGGYVFACESYRQGVDIDTHYGSQSTTDIFVIRVDSNGVKIWTRVLGGSYDDLVRGIALAPGGGCYITGFTHSADIDFVGSHIVDPFGAADGYVIRLDSMGNTVWSKTYGGSKGEGFYTGCADGSGGFLAGGSTYSSDGDVQGYKGAQEEMWLIDVDSNGVVRWSNCYGSTAVGAYQGADGICRDADGSYWIEGYSTKQGNEVDTAFLKGDAWVVHVNDSGTFINGRVLGSPLGGTGSGFITTIPGGAIVGGGYFAAGGLMPSAYWSENSGENGFLIRLSSSSLGIAQIPPDLSDLLQVIPNPSDGKVQVRLSAQVRSGGKVWVADMAGKQVSKAMEIIKGNATTIDCRNQPPGQYLIIYKGEDGRRLHQQITVQ